jgi:hypothetical protein
MSSFSRTILSLVSVLCILVLGALHVHSAGYSQFQIEIVPGPQCFDGQDNDGDGLIDHPDDPGCDSKADNSEYDGPVCGDGSCNGGEDCSTCSEDCGSCPSGGGGGGGGGGWTRPDPVTSVSFSGRAYPLSQVTILKDGMLALTTVSGPDARFSTTLTGLDAGDYTFSVYSTDSDNRRSTPFTFSVNVTRGASTNISGIFLAPTIDVDKQEVTQGETIAIFGQSVPESAISIMVASENPTFVATETDADGAYLYQFDTSSLAKGQHHTRAKTIQGASVSSESPLVAFLVGNQTVLKKAGGFLMGDVNNDNRVNFIDFSIAAFWYKRALDDAFLMTEGERLNGDNQVTFVDFSIMAYYWTG